MGCKVGLGALFFLLASGALFFSCSRKYDYGNIDTPNSGRRSGFVRKRAGGGGLDA